MSPMLRILLILASCGVVYYVMYKIRKKQLNVDDAIYWICFAVALFILSVVPRLATWAADLIGIQSPANFVFMFVMFVTIIKIFHLAIDLSVQKHRINQLVQKLALTNYKVNKNAKTIQVSTTKPMDKDESEEIMEFQNATEEVPVEEVVDNEAIELLQEDEPPVTAEESDSTEKTGITE